MSVPVRGLPERLPEGERIVWQGAPDRWTFARQVLHLRKLTIYFGLIIVLVAATSLRQGEPVLDVGWSVLKAIAVAAVPLTLIAAYAWAVARMTVYTITNRRLVLRIGIALPLTINVPFARIANADMNLRANGSGDLALALLGRDKLAYFVLWPHARPWRYSRPEPMLRSLPDVQAVAQLLARGLAASADLPAPVLARPADDGAKPARATMPA